MSGKVFELDLRSMAPGRKLRPTELRGAIERHLWRLRKEFRARRRSTGQDKKTVLAVLGCQRSGTTLMTRILDRDPNVKVFGEFSRLSSLDKDRIRLNPLDSVARVLRSKPFPLLVLKPLVESQNAVRLLEQLPNPKVLWLYRSYEDVVASNLQKFGMENGINNLRAVAKKASGNWRSERVSGRAREIVEQFYSEQMNRYDAAALFWYVRNDLYFEQSLDERRDVLLVKYEELVREPLEVMRRIYAFAAQSFPGEGAVRGVNAESVGRGAGIMLSDEVVDVCRGMLERLDATYDAQAV